MTRFLAILLLASTARAGPPHLESVSLVSPNRVRVHWTGSGQQFQVRCASEIATNIYDLSYVRPGKHEFDWTAVLPGGYSAWSIRATTVSTGDWSNTLVWDDSPRARVLPARERRRDLYVSPPPLPNANPARAERMLRMYLELPPPLPGESTTATWTLTWQYIGPTTSGVVCRVYESVSLAPDSWQPYRTIPAARENVLDVLMTAKTFFKVCAFDGVEHYDWIINLTADP